MNTKLFTMLIVALALLSAQAAIAQIKDGQWEITTQVEIRGIPQTMAPTTQRQCIDKNQPFATTHDDKSGMKCETTKLDVKGATVVYEMECKGRDTKVSTSGKSTYTGDSMTGTATTLMLMKTRPEIHMTSTVKGKYIGPCPKP